MQKTQHDSETPAHGKQVISAVAFIHRQIDGKHQVFLAKRSAVKKFLPNKWEMVGGHIEYGEDIIEGLKREALEELGIDLEIGSAFEAFTYMNNVKGSHSIEVVYYASMKDNSSEPTINPDDHSEVRWMSREDIVNERHNIIAENDNANIDHRADSDPEYEALLKGFDLLENPQSLLS